MNTISCAEFPALFETVGQIFHEKRDELCALDARMGDGDLGLTMDKGFAALPSLLRQNMQTGDIGTSLMKAAMKMSSVVPSTMGTLMSSGIMEGAKALKGAAEMDAGGLCAYLAGFADGIRHRGKCERGNRTILDAMVAAADRAAGLFAEHPSSSLAAVVDAAVAGAAEGVEATRAMTPVFGKAAVFASKAAGTPDQGAIAGYYMLVGMQKYICG